MMDPGRVANSILHKLASLPDISSNCCIYLVPENLRSVNKDAYRPLLVSIGPVYYTDQTLSAMQYQKLRYLKSFLQRNPAHSIHQYINVLKGWEILLVIVMLRL
ncbi:hypothetical protein KSS87_016593 [Heliosperma pusillum]|nr:hypothetical protein KSS87_016593 [Heliosperma pusillum]